MKITIQYLVFEVSEPYQEGQIPCQNLLTLLHLPMMATVQSRTALLRPKPLP